MNHKVLALITLSTIALLSVYNIQNDSFLPHEPLEAQRGSVVIQDGVFLVNKQRAGISNDNLIGLCEEIENTYYEHSGSPITSFYINLQQNAIYNACPLFKTLREINQNDAKVSIYLGHNIISQPQCLEHLVYSDITLSLNGNSIKDYSNFQRLHYTQKRTRFSLDLSENFIPIDKNTFSFLNSYTSLEFFSLKLQNTNLKDNQLSLPLENAPLKKIQLDLNRNHLEHFQFLSENTFFKNVKDVQLDFSQNDLKETSELLRFYNVFNSQVNLRLNLEQNQISMPEMSYFNNKLTNSYPNGQINFSYYYQEPGFKTFS